MWLNEKQEHELVTGQVHFRKLCNKRLKIISHATLWETLGLKKGEGALSPEGHWFNCKYIYLTSLTM